MSFAPSEPPGWTVSPSFGWLGERGGKGTGGSPQNSLAHHPNLRCLCYHVASPLVCLCLFSSSCKGTSHVELGPTLP